MQAVIEKWCPKCEMLQLLANFSRNARKKDGLEYMCKACNSKRVSTYQQKVYTPEIGRNKNLKQNYGITHEEYEAMLLAQGGVCAVYGLAETAINPYTKQVQNLHVDHCHKTGKSKSIAVSRLQYRLWTIERRS